MAPERKITIKKLLKINWKISVGVIYGVTIEFYGLRGGGVGGAAAKSFYDPLITNPPGRN